MNPKRLRNPGSSQPIDITDPCTPLSLLASQWASFELEVIPMGAPEIQRIEAKRAFFAGAQAVLNLVSGAFEEGLPPEECGKVLPAVGVEIQRYVDNLPLSIRRSQH